MVDVVVAWVCACILLQRSLFTLDGRSALCCSHRRDCCLSSFRSAHEVLRGDTKLLAPEETPEEVIREREQRAAQLAAVQDKLKAAGGQQLGADPAQQACYSANQRM